MVLESVVKANDERVLGAVEHALLNVDVLDLLLLDDVPLFEDLDSKLAVRAVLPGEHDLPTKPRPLGWRTLLVQQAQPLMALL